MPSLAKSTLAGVPARGNPSGISIGDRGLEDEDEVRRGMLLTEDGFSYPFLGPGMGDRLSLSAETLVIKAAGSYGDGEISVVERAVAKLKAAGVWDLLKFLHVHKTRTQGNRLINWKTPGTYNLLEGVAPGFTADVGSVGSGTAYFNSQYTHAAGDNNAHFQGGFVLTEMSSSSSILGVTSTIIQPRTGAGNLATRDCNATTTNTAMATAIGLTVVNRYSAANYSVWKNGVQVNDVAAAVTAPSAVPFYVLARNNGAAADQNASCTLMADFYGTGILTTAQQVALYETLAEFKAAF